jgi:uncharacterized protein (DUF433 family)
MDSLVGRVTIDRDRCGGRPCVRDLRIRVVDVIDLLASGMTTQEILVEHPSLEPKDILACLAYASKQLDHAVLTA